MGDGEQYLGPITVQIAAKRKAEKIIIEPLNKTDGLALPPGLGVPPSAAVSTVELIKVFLSKDEQRILGLCVKSPKALVKEIQESSKFADSKFFTLWSNLKSRGLVAKAETGEGFVILVDWLAPLLAQLDHPSNVRLAVQNDE